MKRKFLLELIENGEGLNCEFKLHFTTHEKIAKEMMAFANTKGGYLIFGVDDNKNLIGVQSEKSEASLIDEAAKNYCVPQLDYKVHYFPHNDKEIVVVEIPESINKPHRLNDYSKEIDINNSVVPIRVNDKSVNASKEMIRVLKSNCNGKGLEKYKIGEIEKGVFNLLKQQERITVSDLCGLMNISYRRASRTLVNMVRAGLLFIHIKDNGEEFFTSASNLE